MATSTVAPNAANSNAEEELFKQTVSFQIPKNMEGIKAIFNKDNKLDEKALVYVVRAGLKQVLNNRTRQRLTERDSDGNPVYSPQEGVADFTDLIHEEPQRQILSQRDKLEKQLRASNLPEAFIKKALTDYDGMVGKDEEDTGNTDAYTSDVVVVAQHDKEGKIKKVVMKVARTDEQEEEEEAAA